jgi:antitoxin YefM
MRWRGPIRQPARPGRGYEQGQPAWREQHGEEPADRDTRESGTRVTGQNGRGSAKQAVPRTAAPARTLSAICPCPREFPRPGTRTATDTVRAINLTTGNAPSPSPPSPVHARLPPRRHQFALGPVRHLPVRAGRREHMAVMQVAPAGGTLSSTTIEGLAVMSITASEARKRLFPLIKKVNEDHDAVEIVSRHGNAVLVSAEDYAALREGAYLLRSPANARRLLKAYDNALNGIHVAEHDLVDPDAADAR